MDMQDAARQAVLDREKAGDLARLHFRQRRLGQLIGADGAGLRRHNLGRAAIQKPVHVPTKVAVGDDPDQLPPAPVTPVTP